MRFAKGKGKETELASSLGSAVIPQGSEATGTQKANLLGPHSQPPTFSHLVGEGGANFGAELFSDH